MNEIKLPDYVEWKKTRPIEITVQIGVGDELVFNNTFADVEEMEMRIGRMERAIELQLREEYDEVVSELEEDQS